MALSEAIRQNIAYAQQKGFDKLHLMPPAETRALMSSLPKNPDPSAVGRVLNTTADGDIPVRLYFPEGEGPFPVVAYFHGGGFVLMSLDTHDEVCRQLCRLSEAVVMSVDYRLAPEHPFPAGPASSLRAVRWLRQHAAEFGADGHRLAVAGDSAGGYMALSVARQLAAEGITLQAQFAAYPVTDHYSAGHASWEENAEGYILTAPMMRWFWDNFLPDAARAEEASLLRQADFAGLPPALILTANYDPLRDEGRAYAEQLHAAGVETTYQNYENVHGFFGSTPEALQLAASFLKEKLNAPIYA
ncbi:alpha/beta hydrolase [Hymenobacter arizonensis]|uniref:Acetyl esterase n=1 Tax=Hymenobacter arizonensis TaxID=1227077 RepID=A0A1I6AJI5_HYMAR|nr:alpha/beta hydrolase [Hymenobacter arizonensis]SFQ68667.1 acetyl esterase [Hymenobacter arizonensis]